MLNQRELDVLSVLWKSEESMTAADIVNQKQELTQSTVTAVLRKLLKNRLVDVDGVTHSGRVLSRTYRPNEESVQAVTEYFKSLYGKFSDVVSLSEMCEYIFGMKDEKTKINKAEIRKLKKFLSEYERSLK